VTSDRGGPGPGPDSCPDFDASSFDAELEALLGRWRDGDSLAISRRLADRPDLRDRLREVLPALLALEVAKPVAAVPAAMLRLDGRAAASRTVAAGAGAPPFTRLGDFRIIRKIGQGGMGVVYEAEQESLRRRVALKVLPFHALLGAGALERFQREVRAAGHLHHPRIVPVYGVGEENGLHYFAMPYIDGESLDRVVARLRELPGSARRLALGQEAGSGSSSGSYALWARSVARVGAEVAEALAYAHSEGILHRDIKPSNLILDAAGVVWIADFGLAKDLNEDGLSRSGDIVGTPRYLAPERLRGWSDARSDVYGLGVTLYELVTLTPVFDATERHELLERVAHDEPVRPRRIDPRVPRDLETIILEAIAKEPARRY